ncbi:acyl-CoA thioester hydrolase/BAAT C-terminal domain-containing protein [Pseudonocardia phyllosphaerae]|uniref:acyl-CoA thioester hydrolase/BAAT C-terminal domain-containing protein n=1 Tax=Pseudonocardia phyllosphaerae TaxID=3390502 RepID=UPI00397E142A
MESRLTDPEGFLAAPASGRPTAAVLVLSGSSGTIETERVRLLAGRGAAALSIRWFGGPGQAPGICEIPLETFGPALDRLAGLADHLGVVGISKGAEAALLLAARDDRIRAVAAFSPTAVAWGNVGPGHDGSVRPVRSSWTDAGQPVPFVPYDGTWRPPDDDGPPAFRGLYEQSLDTYAGLVPAATIPVETITARVLVTGGGDDRVWPSDVFAAQIAERRAANGRETTVVVHRDAGHRILLPGEPVPEPHGMTMARGGEPGTDASIGRDAWPHLVDMFRLRGS